MEILIERIIHLGFTAILLIIVFNFLWTAKSNYNQYDKKSFDYYLINAGLIAYVLMVALFILLVVVFEYNVLNLG